MKKKLSKAFIQASQKKTKLFAFLFTSNGKTEETMNELSLFAGAGGGILAGSLLGWRTVCAVELDPFASSVLCARQNEGCLTPFPIWDDVRTFDGKPWRGIVDVISGGFPCQDISCTGKGAGITGKKSGLWKEFARIIGEVRPRYVFVENSPMLTVRGLGSVLGDLAALGFDANWGVLGAIDAGAPHRRERIWIVGWDADSGDDAKKRGFCECDTKPCGVCADVPDADNDGHSGVSIIGEKPHVAKAGGGSADVPDASSVQREQRLQMGSATRGGESVSNAAFQCGADFPNTDCGGQQKQQQSFAGEKRSERIEQHGAGWWAAEPVVGGVANGLAAGMDTHGAAALGGVGRVETSIRGTNRVGRLRCLGNGQVPACAALAWRTLAPKHYWEEITK
jgi:DNA (cytosine-5)-methyltransferase 1